MGVSDATWAGLISLLHRHPSKSQTLLDKLLGIANTTGALRRVVGAVLKSWHKAGGVPDVTCQQYQGKNMNW